MVADWLTENPAKLSDEQRREYSITQRLPTALEQSLTSLGADTDLKKVLGNVLVDDYIAMKRAEKKMLDDMPENERHVWLIERY